MDFTKGWELLKQNDPEIYNAIVGEEEREKKGIELIPSENYTYPEVFIANGSIFTNKYAEGYPGKRYYGGQDYTDIIENITIERAKQVFRCEAANVQPLSGAIMNTAVYFTFLQPGDTVLGMELSHGGHLTHGAPVTHSGRLYNFVRYKSNPVDGKIDFDHLREVAIKTKPKIVLCGYSSYPRDYNYADFKKIADEVGAMTMADVSHIGGLIAGGAMSNPFDYGFDIVTTTTHKSLRGPRAGLILCKNEYIAAINKSIFPGLQGGPHMNTIAGIAVTLGKALQPEFKAYAKQVLVNAKALANRLMSGGAKLVTNGTDNHMMVVNTVESFGIDGRVAQDVLDSVAITCNKQVVPDDPKPPMTPSGIRLGTPCSTTRGMKEKEMEILGDWLLKALKNHQDKDVLARIKTEVENFCTKFPLPGIS